MRGMDPKIFTGFTLVLVILAGSAAYVYAHPSVLGLPPSFGEQHDSESLFPDSTSTPADQTPTTDPVTSGKQSPTSQTLTGTIACLPHKGDGPHTMECAIGLKTDSGEYYALTNFDYPNLAAVSDRVRVVGVRVTTDDIHTTYDIVGTFQVAQVEKI